MDDAGSPSATASGRLDVGDGHVIAWREFGAADGKPAVVLHGGPGSGCEPWWAELFDLGDYRVILFDQRGCGDSTPRASETRAALAHNTTQDLVCDIERLRESRGIDRWLVLGGSWGSTLGLAYAQAHTARVTDLVLFSVVTTTRREVEWLTRGVGQRLPDAWAAFRDALPAAERGGDLAAAYSRRLLDDDPEICAAAAKAWCRWELALVGEPADSGRFADPAFRLGFARLVTHCFRHAAWLGESTLLGGMSALAGVRGALIHGRQDLGSPADVPLALAERWPPGTLTLLDGAGHGAQTEILAAVRTTLATFADPGH